MTDSSPVFTIHESEEKGRHVVAVRDIAASELILVDVPLLLSPHTKSRAQCLECARWVEGGVSRLMISDHFQTGGRDIPLPQV